MFPSEKYISTLIETQFPEHMREEGPLFVQFVKSYYEWLEQSDNAIGIARSLYEYGDIDKTEEEFLTKFHFKYIFGIPTSVLVNKRFLVKHILDVYRTKGNIQGYHLLFKLLYNEDVCVYIPSRDILRVSDGTWKEPKFLELSSDVDIKHYEGQVIIGSSSKTQALVEKIITQPVNSVTIYIAYISHIQPAGGDFIVNERVVLLNELGTSATRSAASVRGSLFSLRVLSGGQNFKVGQILKIVKRDLNTNELVSYGSDALVRVTSLDSEILGLFFDVVSGGSGFLANNNFIKVYRGDGDTTGTGASFAIQSLSFTQEIRYNSDVVAGYADLPLNGEYPFPAALANVSMLTANVNSPIHGCLTYSNNLFGTINTLTDIEAGQDYTTDAVVFVRSVQTPGILVGNLTYDTTSANVTGDGTEFQRFFANGDPIYLQANSSSLPTGEYHVIKQVVSNTSIVLYGPPAINSTATAIHGTAPPILISNFGPQDPRVFTGGPKLAGVNEDIRGLKASGNSSVASVRAITSGFGYRQGEVVDAYLYSGIDTVDILNGGVGYTNNQLLIFSGGGTSPRSHANGFITTNANGTITSVTLADVGSGYEYPPVVSVRSTDGSNAAFHATLKTYNTASKVIGRVRKTGVGVQKGNWTTTRGFLNSDKYIQDSYFYQDFSYQIKAPIAFEKYQPVIQDTFHMAGTEMFGKFEKRVVEGEFGDVIYSNSAIIEGPPVMLDFINNLFFGSTPSITRNSYATIDDADGNWTEFAPNTLRWSNKGALIEDERTNYIRNNTMQDAIVGTFPATGLYPTNWSVANTAGLTGSIVRLGTQRGIDFIDLNFSGNTTSNNIIIRFEGANTVPGNNSHTYTSSVFLRRIGLNQVDGHTLRISERYSNGDLITNHDTTIDRPRNSFSRREATAPIANTSTEYVCPEYVITVPVGEAVDYTVRIGWPQLERGNFASSPIRTENMAVTRPADIVTVSISGAWYQGLEGSVFVEYVAPLNIANTGLAPSLVAFRETANNTSDHSIEAFYDTSTNTVTYSVIANTVVQASLTNPDINTPGEIYTVCFGWEANNFGVSYQGANVSVDIDGSVTSNLDIINIGRNNSTQGLNSYIRKVGIFSEKLANTDLMNPPIKKF